MTRSDRNSSAGLLAATVVAGTSLMPDLCVAQHADLDELVAQSKFFESQAWPIIEAECLAGCGFPTTVQINSRYYENVMPKDVPEILERLKAQGE